MYVRFLTGALSALLLCSCGNDPASSSEVPDLEVVMSKLLPTALSQESNWRQRLMKQARDRHERLSRVTVGAPDEIAAAKKALAALVEELGVKKAAADEPIAAAAAALEQFATAAPGFYENRDRRCGSDGCGGMCEDKCRVDEVCRDTWCSCVPDCAGRVCGPNGCGGFCGNGVCDSDSSCSKEGRCVAHIISTNSCRPECRRNVRPYVASQTKARAVRDQSTRRQVRHYRTFRDLEELNGMIAAMQKKSTAHAAELKRIAGLVDALKVAKDAEQVAKDKRKALGDKEKDLKKAGREAAKAARTAKRKKQPDAEALATAADQAKAAVGQVREERKALSADLKTKAAAIRAMEKDLKRSAKLTKSLKQAKAKIDAEAKRLQGESKVLQSRAAAEAALVAAKAKAEADKEALDKEYAPKLKAAKEKLDAVAAPALTSAVTPKWNGQSPTAATSELVIRVGKNSRLAGYIAAVKKVRQHWVARYSKEAIIAVTGDPTVDPKDNDWTRANDLMHDQIVICEQLLASSDRMIRIQGAMQSARERSGL